jgi:nitrogenase molybdenum-iron protein alpha/beta subunit
MNLNPLPLTISRSGGCTLTGALAVTTSVRDSITIIHGPDGCAHHNFSLLHATLLDNECMAIPRVLSSHLSESEVIFGGEKALSNAIHHAAEEKPGIIFVLSTCITEMIGDDAAGVCGNAEIPVYLIPTSGFLGGNFETGFSNALIALSKNVVKETCSEAGNNTGNSSSINLIGEKNLEFEVEQNYDEVTRLISLLGLKVNVRFVHDVSVSDLQHLPRGSLNVLREPALKNVGEHLFKRFGTPYIRSFPIGITGTLQFISEVAKNFGISPIEAIKREKKYQQIMLEGFSDLSGTSITQEISPGSSGYQEIKEIMDGIGLKYENNGGRVPIPYPFPTGTAGIRRMLHTWRRALV